MNTHAYQVGPPLSVTHNEICIVCLRLRHVFLLYRACKSKMAKYIQNNCGARLVIQIYE